MFLTGRPGGDAALSPRQPSGAGAAVWGAKWRPLSSANGALVIDDDQDETGIDNEQDAA
jgi:hypothetical protein